MAACSRGLVNSAETLIGLGANIHIKALQTGLTALDISNQFDHPNCTELLQSYV